jgi:3-oxoacyl-[acyl-carrier-protein] synthase III
LPNAFISGTGGYVPPRVVTNDDLATEFGIDTNHEWIHKRTGINERRFVDEGVTCSDLAVPASRQALEAAGIEAGDLDMILFATLSPDMAFPGSGVLLQEKLGLCDEGKFVPCLDIRNQCSGFLYGITTAKAMIEAGMYKNILLVGAETHSPALDMSTRGRTVTSLFGDGAGAVVVSATEEDKGIRNAFLGADGRFAHVLCMPVWNMKTRPYMEVIETDGEFDTVRLPAKQLWPYMEGRQVFKNAIEKMILVLMQACWDQGITTNDIDLFLFHQANMRINEYVAKQLGIPPEKIINNIQKYGNTTAATIPLLMAEAERNGRLKPGMKVAMVAFGSGFTWGASIADW